MDNTSKDYREKMEDEWLPMLKQSAQPEGKFCYGHIQTKRNTIQLQEIDKNQIGIIFQLFCQKEKEKPANTILNINLNKQRK